MANQEQQFLGKGWSFPPTFNALEKSVNLAVYSDDIRQSLLILLSTRPGERIMHPTFGCALNTLIFESISESTITEIKDLIERAILFFETRITLNSIEVNIDDFYEGRIDILLDYTIRSINTRTNMVYPFYFIEGSDLAV
ncbi:GPW/gp25 family protein [Colwellia sp. MB3u-70]|uniref:GPW/gp25 family protein n=1 Tax=unclassified Colwellia TaxID=196834 RepID=UPI0015F4F023|nr:MULTISPECIES: GPW/gp25 family protein [unclassified Colwellia]MBA6293754.1 GPW/gp25 family protein [Colwellia sp. MB3u-8]MBA6306274.1 GPW/gp25 family protein [Colwellia sp. MB3u-70]